MLDEVRVGDPQCVRNDGVVAWIRDETAQKTLNEIEGGVAHSSPPFRRRTPMMWSICGDQLVSTVSRWRWPCLSTSGRGRSCLGAGDSLSEERSTLSADATSEAPGMPALAFRLCGERMSSALPIGIQDRNQLATANTR